MNRKLSFIIVAVFIISFYSCEIINPSEKIPSYIEVDTVMVSINNPAEGSASHNISDCWVYVNNKLIGAFEVPFKIPVLESGKQSIQIEPGIKNSGGNAARETYPLMYGYYIDTLLVEKEVLKLRPVFSYRNAVFDLVEDFEDIGIEFEVSAESDTNINIVSGSEAFEGKSMYFALDREHKQFECKSNQLFTIEKNGRAFLEIDFKTNDYFNFGFFVLEYNGSILSEIRKHVYTFNPTDKWKKVYIDLNYFVNNVNGVEFRLFFTSVFDPESEIEKSEIYIDNVKLLYLSSQ